MIHYSRKSFWITAATLSTIGSTTASRFIPTTTPTTTATTKFPLFVLSSFVRRRRCFLPQLLTTTTPHSLLCFDSTGVNHSTSTNRHRTVRTNTTSSSPSTSERDHMFCCKSNEAVTEPVPTTTTTVPPTKKEDNEVETAPADKPPVESIETPAIATAEEETKTTNMSVELPSTMTGPPMAAYVEPGNCQLTDTPVPCKLLKRTKVSETTAVLRFQCPDPTKPLNLCTCACILSKSMINGEAVVRPYTPISTNRDIGYFDLLVKNYFDKGTMSKHLHTIEEGSEEINFFHIPFNVKLQAPEIIEKYEQVLMIIGGTGITPMIQALHEMLASDKGPKVTVLYGSRTSNDILGREMLDLWSKDYPNKLSVHYVLSAEPEGSSWDGLRGHITKEMIQEKFPYQPEESGLGLWICGPPPMYQALSGPRDEKDKITGVLGELGYTPEQVYKY